MQPKKAYKKNNNNKLKQINENKKIRINHQQL